MADYTPLISRAVGALAENTGEARRGVYERARAALLAQLRNMNPPLPEEHITRERMSLEDAIRKVELENSADSLDAMLEREFASLGKVTPRPEAISIAGARTVSDAAHDAESLGDAAAHAHRTARDQLNAPSAPAEPERIEPAIGRQGPFIDANDGGQAPIRPRVAVLGEDEEKPARKGGGAIAIVLVLLLLGGAGALGWYVASNHPDRLPPPRRLLPPRPRRRPPRPMPSARRPPTASAAIRPPPSRRRRLPPPRRRWPRPRPLRRRPLRRGRSCPSTRPRRPCRRRRPTPATRPPPPRRLPRRPRRRLRPLRPKRLQRRRPPLRHPSHLQRRPPSSPPRPRRRRRPRRFRPARPSAPRCSRRRPATLPERSCRARWSGAPRR